MSWVCPACGEELSDKDATFCGACGSRITAAKELEPFPEDVSAPDGEPIYWSDEDAGSEDDEGGVAIGAAAQYWSDEEEELAEYSDDDDDLVDDDDRIDDDDEDAPDEAMPTNSIPEDFVSLSENINSMIQDGYSPEAKEIVVLKLFSSLEEALMVKGLLDCEGIPSMNNGLRLFVRRDDLDDAREIIALPEYEEGV